MNLLTVKCAGALAVVSISMGCAMDPLADPEVGTASSALVGRDSYLYFRCNATSWDPNNLTRLRSTADPYVFSLLVDVNRDWMTTGGDNCIFTETNQFNGWGTTQTFYGSVHSNLRAPSSDTLQTPGAGFSVIYPTQGRYLLNVNWMQGTFQLGAASAADQWQPCFNEKVTTIAQSPQSPDNMLVGCGNGDIFLTYNGLSPQASWVKVDSWNTSVGTFNLPDLPVNAIAYSSQDIKTAYVAFAGSKQGHKLWKTGTGGANWVEITTAPLSEIWSISVNPLDSLKVYIFGPGGAFMSNDAGASWTANVLPAPLTAPIAAGAKLSTVSVSPSNRDQVWVGATNGDIFYTSNATSAQTWVKITHGMPARAVTHVSLDTTRAPVGVIATFDGMFNDSVWITTNGGFGWANLHSPALPTTPVPLSGIYAFYGVSLNPIVNTVLYIDGTYGAGESTSGGANWSWSATN